MIRLAYARFGTPEAGVVYTAMSPCVDHFPDRAVLLRRIEQARTALRYCNLCEWRCGVDRAAGEPTRCRLDTETHVFNKYISCSDELELIPVLSIYLGGCNFSCRFCNTAPQCFDGRHGDRVDVARLAEECRARVRDGVKTIDLLGGEPSLHVHTLLELAAAANEPLPLALDSNMYMSPEVLEWLDGVVSLYIADFKFGNDRCARRLAAVNEYVGVVTRNLLLASARTPVIIRHLLIPGHGECCFQPVVDWVKRHISGGRFHLYTGYVPCWRAGEDPTVGRLNSPDEVRGAQEYLREQMGSSESEYPSGATHDV